MPYVISRYLRISPLDVADQNQGGWSVINTNDQIISFPISFDDSSHYIPSLTGDKESAADYQVTAHRQTTGMNCFVYPTNFSIIVHWLVFGRL